MKTTMRLVKFECSRCHAIKEHRIPESEFNPDKHYNIDWADVDVCIIKGNSASAIPGFDRHMHLCQICTQDLEYFMKEPVPKSIQRTECISGTHDGEFEWPRYTYSSTTKLRSD
jgi:hypothetical protein